MTKKLLFDSINKTMGRTFPLLKKGYLQVPNNKKGLNHAARHRQSVSQNIHDRIQVRKACWLLNTLYCFSCQQVLYKTSCLRSGTIMHGKYHQWLPPHSVRCQYLVCITLSHEIGICKSVHSLMLIRAHTNNPTRL